MKSYIRALIYTLALTTAFNAICIAAEAHRMLRITFVDASGTPMQKAQIKELICRDLNDEPITTDITLQDGFADIVLPNKPAEFTALIETPGFGEVTIFADAKGKGYTKPGTIDFTSECAATRLFRVQSALKQATHEGLKMPTDFAKRLRAAAEMDPTKSLSLTLALGEELTLARARHRIEQYTTPRKGFLFGCNVFGYPARGPIYQQHFQELFNYGTANLYISGYARDKGKLNFERADGEIGKLHGWGMTAKACPPFYLATSVLPEWIKQEKWPEVNATCYDLVMQSTKHFAGKVPFCEITNEATMSNGLKLTTEQIVEYTRTASKAARDGDPDLQRIINSAHLWGDYAAKPDKQGTPRLSPYAYLQTCIKEQIPFEIVGLQMYYPEYDLFEIDRMLEKYSKLGKPIHITEMGCSSAPGIDPNAQRKKASAGWHGPWTEDMQADWVEAVYTLYYSKPYIHAVSWWDLADAVSFWPYGGFLRGDCSPKPSFTRLKALEEKWGYHFGPAK